eukprot:365978-Chlamydomonas_euryale.AAC.8
MYGEIKNGVEKHRGGSDRLRGGELGDSLGALRHGMLCQLAWQHQAHRGLDLPRRDGRLLGVARQA